MASASTRLPRGTKQYLTEFQNQIMSIPAVQRSDFLNAAMSTLRTWGKDNAKIWRSEESGTSTRSSTRSNARSGATATKRSAAGAKGVRTTAEKRNTRSASSSGGTRRNTRPATATRSRMNGRAPGNNSISSNTQQQDNASSEAQT